jgi:NADPH:quinone reductase-like Zn-dependent oxidoreductase
MIDDGRLHPTVPTEYPLDQAASVMSGLIDRTLSGKVVLVP